MTLCTLFQEQVLQYVDPIAERLGDRADFQVVNVRAFRIDCERPAHA
jgi:hypothetical protein